MQCCLWYVASPAYFGLATTLLSLHAFSSSLSDKLKTISGHVFASLIRHALYILVCTHNRIKLALLHSCEIICLKLKQRLRNGAKPCTYFYSVHHLFHALMRCTLPLLHGGVIKIHIYRTWWAKQAGSKAMCEGPNSCPLLSPTLVWQQPEIWGLPRPLFWEKKDRTAHPNSEKLLSLFTRSVTQTKEKPTRLSVCSFIQQQIQIFISHIHSLGQPHKTSKGLHAWFSVIVCLLNSFISCFSQFGTICLSILLPCSLSVSCTQHCASAFFEFSSTLSEAVFFSRAGVSTFCSEPHFWDFSPSATPACSNPDRVEKGIQLPNPSSLYQEC